MTTLYCTSGQKYGIKKICSNLPVSEWNTKQPSGSQYYIDVHFTLPIAQLIEWSTILNIITVPALESAFLVAGYEAHISNLKLSTKGNNDLIISWTANSPWIYLVLTVVLGILAVIGIYLIDQMTITISKSPILSVGAASLGIAAAIGIALLAILYFNTKRSKLKKKS
ncbi:MAG: hypothetical protein QXL94_06850 [Candidatus Parvarchaeum sp.]